MQWTHPASNLVLAMRDNETSLVLASKPDTVKSNLAFELKEDNVSLSRAIRDGATNFVEAGGPDA